MKRILLISALGFSLSAFPISTFALPAWPALSMLESGDNDRQIGTHGEVSRYQILPREWKQFGGGNLARARDPQFAFTVASRRMKLHLARFMARYQRPPTPFEFYILWNAPAQTGHPSPVVTERATRYANLCSR